MSIFDENTPFPFGHLKGRTILEVQQTEPLELRHFCVTSRPLIKTQDQIDILNFVLRWIDGEDARQWDFVDKSQPTKATKVDWLISFGKFKDKRLSDLSISEIRNYCFFLRNSPEIDDKGKEFLYKADEYLTSKGNYP